jgi:hypothetical protein
MAGRRQEHRQGWSFCFFRDDTELHTPSGLTRRHRVRSTTYDSQKFCNSSRISLFAAVFLNARAKRFTVKCRVVRKKKNRGLRGRGCPLPPKIPLFRQFFGKQKEGNPQGEFTDRKAGTRALRGNRRKRKGRVPTAFSFSAWFLVPARGGLCPLLPVLQVMEEYQVTTLILDYTSS